MTSSRSWTAGRQVVTSGWSWTLIGRLVLMATGLELWTFTIINWRQMACGLSIVFFGLVWIFSINRKEKKIQFVLDRHIVILWYSILYFFFFLHRNNLSWTLILLLCNPVRFKQMISYFNTDTQYANFRGNPLYQAKKHNTSTTDKRSKTMKTERKRLILFWLSFYSWFGAGKIVSSHSVSLCYCSVT